MSDVLAEPLTDSPLRSLFRARFGSHIDRALVFLSPEGEDRVVHPLGRRTGTGDPPSIRMVRRRAFDQVCWVPLAVRDTAVDLATRSPDGRHVRTVRRKVTWRAYDPIRVARRRLSAQDALRWIAYDVDRVGPAVQGSDPVDAPLPEHRVAEAGIAYRLRWSALDTDHGDPPSPVTPSSWAPEQREAYRFYREVVAQGPQSLVALWLLHHPEQGREVLDWTVQNRALLAEQAQWESSLVALLQGLGAEDRAFLGVNMAKILSELGIPGADQVLDQMGTENATDRHRELYEGER